MNRNRRHTRGRMRDAAELNLEEQRGRARRRFQADIQPVVHLDRVERGLEPPGSVDVLWGPRLWIEQRPELQFIRGPVTVRRAGCAEPAWVVDPRVESGEPCPTRVEPRRRSGRK